MGDELGDVMGEGFSVRNLIAALEKMPKGSAVAIREIDNSEDEVSGFVKGVTLQDANELTGTPYPHLKGKIVVLEA